ncbi:MAG: NAD-dependent protein deacetylase [Pseudomonadales bacterium]|nr:NAD-dependent protein deacetylase [Pseudomonadales bacterium]
MSTLTDGGSIGSDGRAEAELAAFLGQHERLFVITGAGLSAPSGIDTYRDHKGQWQSPAPVQHQDFLRHHSSRQRYWARSLRGWPRFRNARPNTAHVALAELSARDRVGCLLTQNVDGLHQRAGQTGLIELHGSLANVVCLECHHRVTRESVQSWLEVHNPEILAMAASPRPDGDAELRTRDGRLTLYDSVQVPVCERCGGVLKPDVVFYGDSVPVARVGAATAALAQADAVLVVGTSLMVYSSFRFCRAARERRLPMAAVNLGVTRADAWYSSKLDADCSIVLPRLVGTLV